MTHKAKLCIFWTIIFLPLILLHVLTGPIVQKQAYHIFADARTMMGINNFMDVMSNVFFIIIGFAGLSFYNRNKSQLTISWKVFFMGVILIAPGSAFYHYNPNDFTLVWDRLPMTIGFSGLFTAVVTEAFSIGRRQERATLVSIVALGIYSVIHWQVFNDLRLYYWIQLTPILTLLCIGLLFNKNSLKVSYLLGAFGFYMLAKIFETFDKQIFGALQEILSGHSLKHALAAVAIYCLYLMKKKTIQS